MLSTTANKQLIILVSSCGLSVRLTSLASIRTRIREPTASPSSLTHKLPPLKSIRDKFHSLSRSATSAFITTPASSPKPSGSSILDIRTYIKELELKTKKKIDCILIDYLDLMMPKSKRISPADLFIKDKYVSEEIRNYAVEKQCLLATASQLNRQSVEEIEFDHSHIAGGLSKIQTADNVIGIFTSRAMKERGRYQIQFMKTRSSSGVGQKVDLEFDVDSLRIRDLAEEENYSQHSKAKSPIYDSLKQKSKVSTDKTDAQPKVPDPTKGDDIGKVKATVEGGKLRQLLNELHSDEEQ